MAATALFRLSPVSRPWPLLKQPEMWEPGVPAISDFVALFFLLGLCFARETAPIRIDFGNQRASDFGLRPKVTKGRFRCASR